MLLLLLLLPGSVYTLAFGKDVTGLRPLLLLLVPGILAMAASQAFSHYFSGTGRNRLNMVASGLGMLVTLGIGPGAVDRWGLHGAALTASLSYITAATLQFTVFLRATRAPLAAFWPGRADLNRAQAMLKGLVHGR
jgi:O-antigen/teichoic acid export membrane protein